MSKLALGLTLILAAAFAPPVVGRRRICGGCQWQMLPYKKQLEYKQKQVEDNLMRIGKVELPPLMPIIGADQDKFYRNKLEYTFSNKEFLPEEEFKKLKNEISESEVGALMVPTDRDRDAAD